MPVFTAELSVRKVIIETVWVEFEAEDADAAAARLADAEGSVYESCDWDDYDVLSTTDDNEADVYDWAELQQWDDD